MNKSSIIGHCNECRFQPSMALQLLRLGKIGLRMSFSNTPLVLPWPLQIGLELATRALLDPGDQSSVDFSRPAGEPALVSPDSVSVMVSRSAREQTAQRFSAIGMRQGGNRVHPSPHTLQRRAFRSGAPGAAACVKMETEPSVLIRPLIATLTQGVSRSRAETDVLQLSRQLCGVLDGAPGAAACVKMETEPSVLIRPLNATLTQGVSRSRSLAAPPETIPHLKYESGRRGIGRAFRPDRASWTALDAQSTRPASQFIFPLI